MTKKAELTVNRLADLQALEEFPDDQIDTTDIPEILDWSGTKRGVSYRPEQRQITLRLDADIVSWFNARAQGGRGFQTAIYQALREHVVRCERGVTK